MCVLEDNYTIDLDVPMMHHKGREGVKASVIVESEGREGVKKG